MPPQDDYRPVFPEIADENYVVFADVLGFREIVRNNDHRGLYEIFDNDLRLAAEFGATGGVADPEFPGYADTDLAMVNMRIISDSVILWPSDTGSADFVWLLKAIQHLIKVSIERGIPVRAALTFGTLTHVRISYNSPRLGGDTLFGLALVDAYEEASNLQWAGGMLMDAAIVRYEATRSRKAPSIAALIREASLCLMTYL